MHYRSSLIGEYVSCRLSDIRDTQGTENQLSPGFQLHVGGMSEGRFHREALKIEIVSSAGIPSR
jgi:hypothetical protein